MQDMQDPRLKTLLWEAGDREKVWGYFWLIQGVRPLLGLCESPIEKLLAVALWSSCPYRSVAKDWLQCQVPIGPYRVDFMLTGLEKDQLVVEVDGHEFHEKTKAQAQHDKERDRFLISQGFQVARFTGSEVFADPFQCAQESWLLVTDISQHRGTG